MAANVETMFYTREKPWHGLGIRVAEALTSKEALTKAGLDWHVVQKPLTTYDGSPVPGYFANIRDKDDKLLGVVTDRYTVIQNEELLPLPMGCWVQELDMRQPAVCRRVEEYGYWLNFPTNTLSGVTGSAPIWCFRKGLFAGALIKGHAEKAVS